MSNIPYFITYPRSGCHWINALFELYFDRIRGPRNEDKLKRGNISFVKRKNPTEEYMWFHTHDKKLDIKPSSSKYGDFFLYRNPMNTLYSLTSIEGMNNFDNEIIYYKCLLEKWVDQCRTVLIYEYAVQDPYKCIEIISNHFEIPYHKERAKLAIDTCTKEKIMGFNTEYHNLNVLKQEYQEKREIFYQTHKEKILNIVVTEKTKPWLDKVL